jgi:hypothetical protein
MTAVENHLVPGRECGACRVCCEDLPIDTEEIQKNSRLLCKNYREGCGCTIYETRPSVCRSYFCGWRLLSQLDENWRPSDVGILVYFQNSGIPEGYAPGSGIEFCLLNPEAVKEPNLAKTVAHYVNAGTPTFLKLLAPQGYKSANVLLNSVLHEVAAAGKIQLVQKGLEAILHLLMNRKTQRAEFTSTANPGVMRQE